LVRPILVGKNRSVEKGIREVDKRTVRKRGRLVVTQPPRGTKTGPGNPSGKNGVKKAASAVSGLIGGNRKNTDIQKNSK